MAAWLRTTPRARLTYNLNSATALFSPRPSFTCPEELVRAEEFHKQSIHLLEFYEEGVMPVDRLNLLIPCPWY